MITTNDHLGYAKVKLKSNA